MSRTSSLGQFTLLPVLADAADITAVGTTMADRIEKYVGMRFATAVARDAVITVPEAGMRAYLTTPQVWTEYDGTAWRGEWVTTFVPQLDQGATTNIAKTTNLSQYRYDGPCIDWFVEITATGAGTAGSPFTLTLPVTALGAGRPLSVGTGVMFRSSTTMRYVVQSELAGSGTLIGFGSDQGGSGALLGQTPSFALAAGDIIRGSARYRWV